MSRPVHLIDGSLYVFRAWHSVDPSFTDAEGWPSHGVYGYTGFLLSVLEQAKPERVAVAFDESLNSSFRNEIYPAYKANREAPDPALLRQFEGCRQITEALGITCLADGRYEADDLIGTLSDRLRASGHRSVIVSADKDLSQLLRPGDVQWDFGRRVRWDYAGVKERYGVHPEQIADFLALTGDPVDNIPGVPGIGAKTAAALLEFFGSLDALLERIEELPFLRLRGARSTYDRLQAHRDTALLARQLTAIALDAPVPAEPEAALRLGAIDQARIDSLFEFLRFGPMTRRRVQMEAERRAQADA